MATIFGYANLFVPEGRGWRVSAYGNRPRRCRDLAFDKLPERRAKLISGCLRKVCPFGVVADFPAADGVRTLKCSIRQMSSRIVARWMSRELQDSYGQIVHMLALEDDWKAPSIFLI